MLKNQQIAQVVSRVVAEQPIVDLHTHLFAPAFGDLLLWGIDDLLTYHYLVAETFRLSSITYDEFWAKSKLEQADLVWQILFIEN